MTQTVYDLLADMKCRQVCYFYVLTKQICVSIIKTIIQKNFETKNKGKGDNMSLPSIFKALSDSVRRDILLKLKQKRKMSAGEIAAEFDLSNATISYHLSVLKKADLIFETRYQKYIYYEINTSVFEDAVMWLMQFKEDQDGAERETYTGYNNGSLCRMVCSSGYYEPGWSRRRYAVLWNCSFDQCDTESGIKYKNCYCIRSKKTGVTW